LEEFVDVAAEVRKVYRERPKWNRERRTRETERKERRREECGPGK
jgi:hypothetical protein